MSTVREPWELGVVGVREAVAAGALTPREVVESCLERIDAFEDLVGAWEHLDGERALAEAAARVKGPLAGVPAGVKDIFNTRDMPTTMGSPAWADFTPGNDARVVHYARMAGSIVLGKTVTAEFAVHTPGKTRNPHDLLRSPGTSSSGSAAGVACGMVPWALGSQTAGSIVRPASYVGIYGFKPSYGTLARTGMLKTTDSLDQVGFFVRGPSDLAPVFDVLRVHGRDYPLVHETLDAYEHVDFTRRRPHIGLLTDGFQTWSLASPEAQLAIAEYGRRLAAAGVDVVPVVPPPLLAEAHLVHDVIYDRSIAYYFQQEASDGTLVSDVILAMWDRGTRISLDEYREALRRQHEIRAAFEAWAEGFDAIVTLSTAGPGPLYGAGDVPDTALVWTLCGAPVVSAPVFRSADGLPFGAQFVASRFHDYELVELLRWLHDRELAPSVAPVTPTATPLEVALAGESADGGERPQ